MNPPVLALEDAAVYYPQKKKIFASGPNWVQILFHINLELHPGEILAVVGESGSGKSTLGKSIIGLVPRVTGDYRFQNELYDPLAMDHLRKHIQIVFQDPYSSLNPRMTIGQTLSEVIRMYPDEQNTKDRLGSLIEDVQMPEDALHKYPHELSGGQRQRVCIARALAVGPEVLICDEIVSALDVSVQAKILNLVQALVRKQNLAILFTTHDLHVVESFADNVLVMHRGRIVESGPVEELFANPRHDYTQSLLASIPGADHGKSSEFLMSSSSS